MLRKLHAALVLLATLTAIPAWASDDHDHGAAPAAATGPALPRFATSSELFELVGVANGKQLTVYLDRFTDNSPVKGAKVELEVGGAKVALKEHAEGEFEGALAQELKPGVTPVTATVTAGTETDILASEFDIHAEEHAEAASVTGWKRYVGWAVGGVVVLIALAWLARRTLAPRRVGGAA